ncbi:regulator of microtubule dynamics protein 1 [Calliopsis andreniformis]|uniref:regulator of microtubule dynamics protein 1 n=1 Tax=Calliopsis andreniformis TaxID=337506 RepID=UPI003FCDC060
MNHLQHSNLIAAAIGVTVGVISAAGIFIYHKILENQQHSTAITNLNAANKKIAELQAELEALRVQQNQQKKKRKFVRKVTSNDSTYSVTDNDTDVDAFSTADTDIGDDEFYDCSDSESILGDNDRISEELNQLDSLLKENDKGISEEFNVEIYYKLQSMARSQPDNVDVIWRFAKACYDYAETIDDPDLKRTIILEGIEYCERILNIEDPDLYKWYAILIGINGDYLPTAEQIQNGVRFKSYVEKALEMRPHDSQLHYLLGRFKYETASLNWIKRKVAATLFAEVPKSTHEEALACFETAAKLGNNSLYTQLYTSKCHIALNQYSRAIDLLKAILEQPVVDEKLNAEASKLLNKYSGYCS